MTEVRNVFGRSKKRRSDCGVGVKQTQKALVKETARGVIVAMDASDHITGPVRALCGIHQVPVETVPTMQELGKACGIHVGAAVAAVLETR